MRRPGQMWLVIAEGEAEATFDDYADAQAYAHDTHPGATPHILCLPHWPTGMWRYGIETPTSHTPHDPGIGLLADPDGARVSPVVQAAHRRHTRTNRRCRHAGIELRTPPHAPARYHCEHCGDRIL